MANYSDKQTEKKLIQLEKKLQKEYSAAYEEISRTASDYMKDFKARDNAMREALANGNYPELFGASAGMTPEEHYRKWRMNQIARGERWEKCKSDIAQRLVDTNQIAAAYINDDTPSIYSLNYKYSAFEIEKDSGVFDIYDEQAAKNLIEGNNQTEFRTMRVNPQRDYEWNQKKIQSALTSAIIQGQSISKLTDSFIGVMKQNRNAAIRNARTAYTSAQNAGRVQSYKVAEEKGIELEQEWMSAGDGRVRDSHAELNGVRVKVGEKFPNGCRYPADPQGRPAEVYNCRCTLVSALKGHHIRETGKTVESYKEWEKNKDTIYTGAQGALNNKNDRNGKKRERHAKLYYAEIRNVGKESFVRQVTKNDGVSENDAIKTFEHIFENKYWLEGKMQYFYEDYDMAESFRRLRTGVDVQEHDKLLIKHEALEHDIMEKNKDMSYNEAHDLTNETYNYQKALAEWKKNNA